MSRRQVAINGHTKDLHGIIKHFFSMKYVAENKIQLVCSMFYEKQSE